jgi:hypothetical protein
MALAKTMRRVEEFSNSSELTSKTDDSKLFCPIRSRRIFIDICSRLELDPDSSQRLMRHGHSAIQVFSKVLEWCTERLRVGKVKQECRA